MITIIKFAISSPFDPWLFPGIRRGIPHLLCPLGSEWLFGQQLIFILSHECERPIKIPEAKFASEIAKPWAAIISEHKHGLYRLSEYTSSDKMENAFSSHCRIGRKGKQICRVLPRAEKSLIQIGKPDRFNFSRNLTLQHYCQFIILPVAGSKSAKLLYFFKPWLR